MLAFQVSSVIMKAINLYEKHQLCTDVTPSWEAKMPHSKHMTQRAKEERRERSQGKDIECFNCHKKGHLAATATAQQQQGGTGPTFQEGWT